MIRVTIADADPASRSVLADALGAEGHEIVVVRDGESIASAVAGGSPGVLLVDVATLVSKGPAAFGLAGAKAAGTAVIAIADAGDTEGLAAALAAGATDCILRPPDPVIARARVSAAAWAAEARQQAAGADRFVDRLCHEFRTPLAVVREYASILEEGTVDPVTGRQREFLRVIADAAADMARLAADVQDGVRLKSGQLRLDLRPCRVSDVLDPVVPIVETRAAGRGVCFSPQIECPSREVFADEPTIRRVVANLAIAAVKLSPSGGQAVLWARADGASGVEIGVTSGPVAAGAGKEIARRLGWILEGDQAGGDGMGLGLGIVSALVRLHLGRVRAGSDGQGRSTISFVLPGCEPETLLEWYFDRLCEDRPGGRQVFAFRVGWCGELSRQDVWSFLASRCDPWDLVMPVPGEGGLLVVGPSGSVGGWIDRLRRGWDRAVAAGGPVGGIQVDPVGSWSLPRRRKEAQSLLAGVLGRKPAPRRAALPRRQVPSRAARGVG